VLAQRRDGRPDGGGADGGGRAAAEIAGISPSSTVGSIGAARRIRHAAAAENDITTARDRSAEAGDAMPYRCSKASTLLSTSAP
jgi:hypothetical protein